MTDDNAMTERAAPLPSPERTRFVLINTSHAGNVGAAARAMKVMGFADLVLVQPRFDDVHRRDEALAMASGATDVLAARAARRLAGRGAGGHHLGLRDGDDAARLRPADLRAARRISRPWPPAAHRVAFVFGAERFGLANDDVYRCHACVSIPTDPAYGSLNLAQAVQLIAYDWRQALGGFAGRGRAPPTPRWPTRQAMHGLLAHWQAALVQIGFLDPARAEEADAAPEPAAQPRAADAARRCTSCAASRARSVATADRPRAPAPPQPPPLH